MYPKNKEISNLYFCFKILCVGVDIMLVFVIFNWYLNKNKKVGGNLGFFSEGKL